MIPSRLYGRDTGALRRSLDMVEIALLQTEIGESFCNGRNSPGALFAEVPTIDAREGYVLPFQRREVPQMFVRNLLSASPQLRHDPLQVDGVPQPYRRRQQREPAGAALLVLIGASRFRSNRTGSSVGLLAKGYRPPARFRKTVHRRTGDPGQDGAYLPRADGLG